MAHDAWDDESWYVLSARLVELARDAGALSVLPIGLNSAVAIQLFAGEFAVAASLAEEAEAIREATGNRRAPYGALVLAAWTGREAATSHLIEATTKEAVPRGEGQWLTATEWATAVLYNGLGRFDEALAAAEQASQHPHELGLSTWALVELIEAAARSGSAARAARAVQLLSEMTRACGTDWALGIEARSRALLNEGQVAEALYREAIERLGRTRLRAHLARAHLLYGEWLRRERRRKDARDQLRTARELFVTMGTGAFAQRAEQELLATGETARKRIMQTSGQLTAQETQVARLARDGLSNPEIGARLFISPRTVEYHLHKVFAKLRINYRNQLDRVLPPAES
jgi:DNA-binding CsgD family transcriptional regulator